MLSIQPCFSAALLFAACLAFPDAGQAQRIGAAPSGVSSGAAVFAESRGAAPIRTDTRLYEKKAGQEPFWKPRFSISGEINRMLLHADDGRDSRLVHTDNSKSRSRIDFEVESRLGEDLSAGAFVTTRFFRNSSERVRIRGDEETDDLVNLRNLNVFIDSGTFGRFVIGHGGTASDGIAETDFSGTGGIAALGTKSVGAALRFVDSDAAGRRESFRVGQALESPNGLGAWDRVRYTLPSFRGFSLSASVVGEKWLADESGVEAGSWDVALRYRDRLEGFRLGGQAAWWKIEPSKGNEKEGFGGAAAIWAPSRTSFEISYSSVPDDGIRFWGVRLGQGFHLFEAANTLMSVGYDRTHGPSRKGASYDLAAVQRIGSLARGSVNLELLGLYKVYSAEFHGGPSVGDISVASVGIRIKFAKRFE